MSFRGVGMGGWSGNNQVTVSCSCTESGWGEGLVGVW